MTKPIRYTRWIRVLVTDKDKHILGLISEFNGSMSEASTIRRLIRDEGRRLGILPSLPATDNESDLQTEPAR